jgi:integrase/recombinase XerC
VEFGDLGFEDWKLWQRRDRLIIELIFLTGLRVSEVLGITPDDIDFRNRTIRIHGKGSHDRTVYPPRELLYDLVIISRIKVLNDKKEIKSSH